MRIEHHIDLQPFNTFGFSSIAERLVHVGSPEDVVEYFTSNQPAPSLVLGGGSNLLLTRDLPGTTLKVELPGIELVEEDTDHVYVKVGAGEVWHDFVLHAISQGWAGVENLSLIPGNVGAAPMQNIGAYGVEIKDVFHQLEAFVTDDKSYESFNLADCAFGYRESVFKRGLKHKAIITSVTFKLNKRPSFNTSYGAINQQLEAMGIQNLSIKAVSDAVISIRQSKLPDPKKIGNSGSFFKNPVVEQLHFEQLQDRYAGIVGYPAGEGKVKVAAGWLIENAGFKGKRIGNYGVHAKQALVLVNYGGAAGKDLFQLSEEIISTVNEMYEITLEREVNVI
ncbi:MAG: UDP-N-acetylmuramate dehydrogenase [Flavobacteriales bacterium]|nr:UDP-N-acetylmuramate dehydrogenase [Flavobacteriales bacterium]